MEKKISVVIIPVKNMGRAVKFYQTVLGLPLKFQTSTYSEFKTKGAVLALEKRNKVVAHGPSFTFQTKNIRQDEHLLKKQRVKFWRKLKKESFGWVLMPQDSEGNIFEIAQYKFWLIVWIVALYKNSITGGIMDLLQKVKELEPALLHLLASWRQEAKKTQRAQLIGISLVDKNGYIGSIETLAAALSPEEKRMDYEFLNLVRALTESSLTAGGTLKAEARQEGWALDVDGKNFPELKGKFFRLRTNVLYSRSGDIPTDIWLLRNPADAGVDIILAIGELPDSLRRLEELNSVSTIRLDPKNPLENLLQKLYKRKLEIVLVETGGTFLQAALKGKALSGYFVSQTKNFRLGVDEGKPILNLFPEAQLEEVQSFQHQKTGHAFRFFSRTLQ